VRARRVVSSGRERRAMDMDPPIYVMPARDHPSRQ
jgi:hypothetical protein